MSDFKPDEIYRELEQAGVDWADKKSAYEALDDLTKTVLADITSNYLPPTCATKSEAEIRAIASADYKHHLATKAAARKAWLLAEVKWKNFNTLSELRRSEESTRRSEMNLR